MQLTPPAGGFIDAPVVYLASCASCGASGPDAVNGNSNSNPTTYATDVPHPDPFHCPKCQPGMLTAAEQLAEQYPAVSFVDENPGARWCVLEQLPNDLIRVRRQGLPDSTEHVRSVHEIRPRFSYHKLEAARRAAPRRGRR